MLRQRGLPVQCRAAAKTRISGHGACLACAGETPKARSDCSSRAMPYRTPWSLIHHSDSRLVAVGAALVVMTRFVAPGADNT